MTYHGFTPNEELKEYLKTAHIHAYPSTWIETSCRAMLEAMSAGLLCVHPNYGALAETSGSLNFMYQGDSDPNIHANIFYQELNSAYQRYTEDNDTVIKYLKFVKSYTDNRYHIEKVHGQWESLLDSLVKKYPTTESRAFPAQQFVYRTT
jgi:glycosyltransferase involved in cell wall biosynthesis